MKPLKGLKTQVFFTFCLVHVLGATAPCNFSTSELQKGSEPAVFCTFCLANVLLATAACKFCASELPKVVRACCVLYILTCKCASRYSGVKFFDIETSKSGPSMLCFVHCDLKMCFSLQRRAIIDIATSKSGPSMLCFVQFDLQMCFSLQRREIFRHRNFQKWSEHAVFCAL